MAEAYSGLRIRRKRVHSAKCSCCCSDDELTSGRKEEGEVNSKPQTVTKKRRKSKKPAAEVEDENNNWSNSEKVHSQTANVELQENSKDAENCSADVSGSCDTGLQPAKKKVARSCDRASKSTKPSKQGHKESEQEAERMRKSKVKTISDRRSTRIAKNLQNYASKSKSSSSKQSSAISKDADSKRVEKSLGDKEENSNMKPKNRLDKNITYKKGKNTKQKEGVSENSTETESVDNESKAKKKRLSKKKVVQDDSSQNSGGKKSVNSRKQTSTKSGIEQVPHTLGNAQQPSNSRRKAKLKVETLSLRGSQETSVLDTRISAQDERRKTHKKTLSLTLDDISRTKIKVFDHLFEILKKCPNHGKTTLQSAATFFLGLDVEHISPIIRSRSERSQNDGLNNAEEALWERQMGSTEGRLVEDGSGQRAGESDVVHPVQTRALQLPQERRSNRLSGEMNLSEAAETLVSIKGSPASRQDANDPGSGTTDEQPKGEENVTKSTEQDTALQLVEPTPFVMQGPGLQAMAPTETLQNSTPLSPLPSLGLQQPHLFPQMPLPPLMGALPQFAMAPNSFTSLGQLFPQTNCNPLLLTATSNAGATAANTVASRATAMPVQTLLFGGHPPLLSFPPMPVSSSGVTPAKTFVSQSSSLPTTQPLPLKGMEELIGNVGASSPSMLWNVKPSPIVYLASPQTLGGVPRNLVPGVSQNFQGIPAGNECDSLQGGLPPGHHNTDSSDKGPRMMLAATTSTSVQRPILPREHVTGATQVVPSSAALKVAGDTSGLAGNVQNQQGSSGLLRNSNIPSLSLPTQSTSSLSTSRASSTAHLTAKQAVKKFVRERTRSAELRKEGSVGNLGSLDEAKQSYKVEASGNAPPVLNMSGNSIAQQQSSPKSSDFNLQQAATTLLSIAVPEGAEVADGDESPEEPEEEVIYTSKGMFRVGDVDVDPQYNSIGREGYTCGKCGKIFTSLSYLARHIKRVCPDMSCRKWKCNRCDKAFRHPFGLQQHIYTHTGERPHKCPECPKAFYSSNDLRRHSRIHSGERPYRCKHCQKTFATTISLKTHTYIHTGEKPHKCPHCPKTFATSSKLGRHIVTHSEQRPFSCDRCPKAFNRSGDLRRHSLHVHETHEKPAEDGEYDVPVSTAPRLDVHRGTHTEVEPSEN